ncbi:hypothetical protein [Alteribacter populi]|nr:hypothetical protein [Alteribacter populi]
MSGVEVAVVLSYLVKKADIENERTLRSSIYVQIKRWLRTNVFVRNIF